VPLLAHLAVAGCVRLGDERDPATRWPVERWWTMPEVRIDGAGVVRPLDATSRARLLDELPPEALAAAAAERLDADRGAGLVETAWLAVRAALGGRRPPPGVSMLRTAAEALLADGHPAEAGALAAVWTAVATAAGRPAGEIDVARVLQATALTRLGRFDDAARSLDGLGDDAHADVTIEARLVRAELGFLRGDYPAARAAAEAVMQAADAADEARAAARSWATYAATWQGDLDGAEALREGMTGPTQAYLEALHHYYRGALDAAEAGFAALASAPSLALRAAAASGSGLVAHRRGDLAAAREGYDAGRELAEQAGDRSRVLNMTMNIAILDHEGGDIGRALRGYRAARGQAQALGDSGAEARCLLNEGILAVSLGRFGDAGRMLGDATRRFAAAGNDYLRAMALAADAEAARRGGDVSRARRLVDEALAAVGEDGVETERIEILLEAVHVSIDAGDAAAALTTLAEPLAAARRAAQEELVGRARAARGRALLGRADQEREAEASRTLLERAIDELAAALEVLPPSKPMHRVATAVDCAVAQARAGRWSAASESARLARAQLRAVHATLAGRDADAFRAAPALAMTWAVAELLSESAAVSTAAGLIGSARGGVQAPEASTALLALLQRLSGERDRGRLLEGLLDAAAVLTGAERSFLLLDEARHSPERVASLRVAVARNIDRGRMDGEAYALSRSIAEEVFAGGERVIATDAQRDPRFAEHASVHAAQLRSILVVPLSLRGRTIGVLYVDNRFAAGAFEAGHARVLEALAAQAAIAIDTADLLERQRADAAALEQQRAEIARLNERLSAELERTQDALASARLALAAQRDDAARGADYADIVGESPRLQTMFRLMDRVRDHDFPVLIRGESGTGKELVARALHHTGARRDGPFVAVNCGAVPENLLESELFGHVRGAFTGAVQAREGLWAQADGGTLMLDEVGEMPPSMQVKLLRVLQTGEFTPVGGGDQRKADVRVLAATHRDLAAMVREGGFREDLLYRLRVVELPVPALRERAEDLPLLAAHFLELNRAAGIGTATRLTRAALRLMERHPWPGNIRELETVLKSACVFADGEAIDASDLQPLLERNAATRDPHADPGLELGAGSLDDIITRAIAARVEACDGNKSRAARSLGIDRGTLYNRLRTLDKGDGG
jgi:transcriptional regulator with GAF, ATPase, and Fis domain